MGFQLLFAAIYVTGIVAIGGAIFWVLRRLGAKPSFIVCVGIAICLLALLSNCVATYPWHELRANR